MHGEIICNLLMIDGGMSNISCTLTTWHRPLALAFSPPQPRGLCRNVVRGGHANLAAVIDDYFADTFVVSRYHYALRATDAACS